MVGRLPEARASGVSGEVRSAGELADLPGQAFSQSTMDKFEVAKSVRVIGACCLSGCQFRSEVAMGRGGALRAIEASAIDAFHASVIEGFALPPTLEFQGAGDVQDSRGISDPQDRRRCVFPMLSLNRCAPPRFAAGDRCGRLRGGMPFRSSPLPVVVADEWAIGKRVGFVKKKPIFCASFIFSFL